MTLDELLKQLVEREGGVADVGDGKGVTRWGQTPDWLAQFGLPEPHSPAEAVSNYKAWINKTGMLPIMAPGDGLSDIMLDVATMSGHVQAIKMLQTSLGVPSDGAIGPRTLAALSACDRRKMTCAVIAQDMVFEARVVQSKPERLPDLAGWMNRLGEHVRRLA